MALSYLGLKSHSSHIILMKFTLHIHSIKFDTGIQRNDMCLTTKAIHRCNNKIAFNYFTQILSCWLGLFGHLGYVVTVFGAVGLDSRVVMATGH